jgi:hypothetical protein
LEKEGRMKKELINCPFCGSPAEKEVQHSFHPQLREDGTIYESRFVQCSKMYSGCMAQGDLRPSKQEAITVWNKRVD